MGRIVHTRVEEKWEEHDDDGTGLDLGDVDDAPEAPPGAPVPPGSTPQQPVPSPGPSRRR